MKIIAQTDINWGGERYVPGDELSVPDDLGARWCLRGAAKPAEAAPVVSRSKPRAATSEE